MAGVGRPSLRQGLQLGPTAGQGLAEQLPDERIRPGNKTLHRLFPLFSSSLSAELQVPLTEGKGLQNYCWCSYYADGDSGGSG